MLLTLTHMLKCQTYDQELLRASSTMALHDRTRQYSGNSRFYTFFIMNEPVEKRTK